MVQKLGNLLSQRLKNLPIHTFFHMWYIEPIVFVLVFAHSLSGTIARNQIIYQACTTVFHYNETDCLELGKKNVTERAKSIETEVQPYIANLFMIRTLLESIVPAICGVFVGSWSDHYGRRPLLLISMIGFSFTYVLTAIICELSNYYVVNPWYYIIAVVPHSVLGGNCVFSVAAFCFISDVTDTKTRPYRMIFIEAFLVIGLMSGALLSSFVYEATNATITFGISSVLMILATLFIVFYVPESLNLKQQDDHMSVHAECSDFHMNCATGIANGKLVENAKTLTSTTSAEKEADNYEMNDQLNATGDVEAATENMQMETKKGETETNELTSVNEPKITTLRKSQPEEELPTLEITTTTVTITTQITKKPISTAAKEIDTSTEATAAAPTKAPTEKTNDNGEENKNKSLFSYEHIKDMLVTCCKERPYYDRAIIWLVTGTMFMSIFVFDGAMTVFYLFAREKFHWTVRDYTFFETISHLVPVFGTLIGFLILRKIFKMSVVTMAILAFSSDMISSICKGVASEPWHLYLSVALGIFRSVGNPMCRTIVSNIVPPTDLGKIFSIKNVLQSVAPFVASPLYTVIYKQSLTTFPGLFNIVSAFFYLVAVVLLLLVLRFKYLNREHYAIILK